MGITDLQQLFKFVGGLGMFLYGMDCMSKGLQQSAGGKLKGLMEFLTSNRFFGVLVGLAITAIIQSSSATTVMVVGFVNAGIINLTQAVGVIMGANIGTTVTAWLVSMSEWGDLLKPEFFAPIIVFWGVLWVVFARSKKKNDIGGILIGLGLLFIGLSFMSDSIKPYRDAPIFAQAFTVLGKNPILGILTGVVVTGIIQSSSASVGILQTLAMNGIVNWQSAIFITLGQNIGTCVTALLASTGVNRTAKRAAFIHLLFNTIGAVIFGIIMFIVFVMKPDLAFSPISSVEISIFHTVFNITNTIILFPLSNLLVTASGVLVKEKASDSTASVDVIYQLKQALAKNITATPTFALSLVSKELLVMGDLVLDNTKRSIEALKTNDVELIQEVISTEKIINQYETLMTEYLVPLHNRPMSEEEQLLVKHYLNTIGDLERIADHAENIAELAQEKQKDSIQFSEEALKDLQEMTDCVLSTVEHALLARRELKPEYVRTALKKEDEADSLEEDLREKHIARLTKQECKVATGIIFLDALNNLERIADHATNIAQYVRNEL